MPDIRTPAQKSQDQIRKVDRPDPKRMTRQQRATYLYRKSLPARNKSGT